MKGLFLITFVFFISGCTAVQVTQIDRKHNLEHVCIENNPKVIVDGFVEVVVNGLNKHGISSEVYAANQPKHCEVMLTYTAFRSWDFAPYLTHAELRLFKDNQRIGYAEYRLRGKGGLALNKWASVESKMTPVVDELLGQYPATN
ncbi:Sbal_3080 family lipoprotein [Pseudidiomarina sp. E22-M8]|uniref:Sbal_3080 family lipoprotein n=1 Tax=Pseudidiomarina sp. E22-M8 TaxID=3424768 RepID=UPI00403CCC2F